MSQKPRPWEVDSYESSKDGAALHVGSFHVQDCLVHLMLHNLVLLSS